MIPRRFSRRYAVATCIAVIAALAVSLERRHHPQSAAQQEGLPTITRVHRAIDGDTVALANGLHIRYIGIDTPETRRRKGGGWVEDPEPYAREAGAFNRALVEGKLVRLEYDAQTYDKYNRLLAYVYISSPDGKSLMVNEELLRQGYAQLLTIPPDVRYTERFKAAAQEAREAKRGLWGLEVLPGRRARRRKRSQPLTKLERLPQGRKVRVFLEELQVGIA